MHRKYVFKFNTNFHVENFAFISYTKNSVLDDISNCIASFLYISMVCNKIIIFKYYYYYPRRKINLMHSEKVQKYILICITLHITYCLIINRYDID